MSSHDRVRTSAHFSSRYSSYLGWASSVILIYEYLQYLANMYASTHKIKIFFTLEDKKVSALQNQWSTYVY